MSPSDCVMCWVDNNGGAWAADYTNADDTAPSTFTGTVRLAIRLGGQHPTRNLSFAKTHCSTHPSHPLQELYTLMSASEVVNC